MACRRRCWTQDEVTSGSPAGDVASRIVHLFQIQLDSLGKVRLAFR